MPESKPTPIKLKLFEALEEAFPGAEVTVRDYPPGHQKLAARRLVHAHIGARVLFTTDDGRQYAVAGMLLATASEKDVDELVARFMDDKRRTEIVMTPGRVF